MKVLSLFDGISCARVALERANIPVEKYYASEIDKYAIKVSQRNYPDIIHLGDIKKIKIPEGIDLLIGGSPCQDLSIAKKGREGLKGSRSSLFWEYVRILKAIKPKYFLLENVASMTQADQNTISEALGVQPVLFNAALVSAQSRKRLFWTNIKFTLPEDKHILLKDILENIPVPSMALEEMKKVTRTSEGFLQVGYYGAENACKVGGQALRVYDVNYKAPTFNSSGFILNIGRRITVREAERLQSLPDNYTEGISNTQRYKCISNAFNVNVVSHILSGINIV